MTAGLRSLQGLYIKGHALKRSATHPPTPPQLTPLSSSAFFARGFLFACSRSDLAKGFPAAARVAVRSSANSEDLEKVSGAGLHDSVLGVDLKERQRIVASGSEPRWPSRRA